MSYNSWLLQHGRLRANAAGHRFRHWPAKCRCPYPYCERCGLVALKNDESRRAAKGRCPADMLAPGESEDGIVVQVVR